VSSPFSPSSIPSGSTLAGSPFSPGLVPGLGGSGIGGGLLSAGTLTLSSPLVMGGFMASQVIGPSVAVWPAANLAICVPFCLPAAQTVRHMAWCNGGAVSGNVDAGVYNEDGTKVITTGSTAQAGLNVLQIAAVTATPLAAGSYFMVLCSDNITGQWLRVAAIGAANLQGSGLQQAAAAVPLGATLTLANPANAFIPWFAVGFSSVL
jgi:hypothetical protein